jgi:hypothetical protein
MTTTRSSSEADIVEHNQQIVRAVIGAAQQVDGDALLDVVTTLRSV